MIELVRPAPLPAAPDIGEQDRTDPDIVAELAELKRQNQKLAAEIAAMKEEDVKEGFPPNLPSMRCP